MNNAYCVSPSCAHVSSNNSQYCSIHNGTGVRYKDGSVMYLYDGKAYCATCKEHIIPRYDSTKAFCNNKHQR